MSRLPEYRAYLKQRIAEIQEEISVLRDLETDRSALFSGSSQRIADKAVLEAAAFSNGANVRPQLEARAEAILKSSVPLGLNDPSPVTSKDAAKKFVSESLVLTGLAVKASPRDFVQGALQVAAAAALEEITKSKVAVDFANDAILAMTGLQVGQGSPLVPTDPRLDGIIRSLDEAANGARRMLANVNAPQALTTVLAAAVQSFLNSAMSTLGTGTGTLGAITAQADALIAAGNDLIEREEKLASYRKNLRSFRSSYESRVSGFASDRAQAAGLVKEIESLRAAVDAARVLTDLSSFRAEWTQELALLLAMTRESKTEAASSVFVLEPDLALVIDTLAADLELIPETDLSALSGAILAMRAYLTGTSTSADTQARYALAASTATGLITVLGNRILAMEAAIARVDLDPTDTVDQILNVLEGVKATRALDSIKAGDISGFLDVGLGSLNPADQIASEIQKFRSDGFGKGTSLVRELSEGLVLIHGYENDDILADQGFEASKDNSIALLEDDLQQLLRLQSILDRADRAR